jgi:hypothetical protein
MPLFPATALSHAADRKRPSIGKCSARQAETGARTRSRGCHRLTSAVRFVGESECSFRHLLTVSRMRPVVIRNDDGAAARGGADQTQRSFQTPDPGAMSTGANDVPCF